MYYKHVKSLMHNSIILVSDNPRHDKNFVFRVLTKLAKIIKETLSHASHIYYWKTPQLHIIKIRRYSKELVTIMSILIFLHPRITRKQVMERDTATQLGEWLKEMLSWKLNNRNLLFKMMQMISMFGQKMEDWW